MYTSNRPWGPSPLVVSRLSSLELAKLTPVVDRLRDIVSIKTEDSKARFT